MSQFLILFFIITLTTPTSYVVGLTSPFLIDNNHTNIKYIGSDFEGNFLVSLENSQGRKYDPTFTTYVNFTMPQAATLLVGVDKAISGFTASNGSALSSSGEIVTSLSLSNTAVRDYNYNTLSLLNSYMVNDTINYNYAVPLNISNNIQTFHLLFCMNSLKVAFNNTVINITSFYNAGEQNYDVAFSSDTLSVVSNLLTITVNVYLTQSGSKIYKASVIANLQYDPSTNQFTYIGLGAGTMNLIYSMSFQGTTLSLSNALLLIQNTGTGSVAMYNTGTNSIGTVIGFSTNPIYVFFYIYSQFYAIQSDGLALITFSSSTNTLTVFSLSIPLLTEVYGLSYGNQYIDPFYIVDQPYVYKAGVCSGQTLVNLLGICISYSCLTPHCSSCPVSPLFCGVCDSGYDLSPLSLCTVHTNTSSSSSSSNSTTTSNSNTNSSSDSSNSSINSSSSSNSSSNSTSMGQSNSSQSNSSSGTSGTNDSYSNPDNSTQSFYYPDGNSWSSNQSDIESSEPEEQIRMYIISQIFWDQLLSFLNSLLSFFQTVISIPSARRVISPMFYYFGVFDDLYFYQFHDRVYGNTMQKVFDQLNQIQINKWNIINYQDVVQQFSDNPASFNDTIDYQGTYLTYNWTDRSHPYLGTESVLGNCQNFFFVALPMVLIGFIFCRVAFKLLFNYRISKIFRKFDFLVFLPLLLFDGNIQQFCFYLSKDVMNVFFFKTAQKVIKVGVLFFGLMVLLYSCSVYILSYIAYKRLNAYFTDNNKNSLVAIWLLNFQNGLRNMLLGAFQCILRPLPYRLMLNTLIIAEVTFLVLFLASIRYSIYKRMVRIWIYVILNMVKIFIIFTLMWDYNNINIPLIQVTQQILLLFQLSLFFLGIGIQIVYSILEMKFIFTKIICTSVCKTANRSIAVLQQLVENANECKLRTIKRKNGVKLPSVCSMLSTEKSSKCYLTTPLKRPNPTQLNQKRKKKISMCKDERFNPFMLYRVVGSVLTNCTNKSTNESLKFQWKVQKS